MSGSDKATVGRWVRRAVPFLISAVALAFVASSADLAAFRSTFARARWELLPLVGLTIVAIVIAFGWRWQTVLREAIPFRRAVLLTAIGLAANQILPFRGGDALRVALSSRGASQPTLHASISALALEKVFDLVAVATFAVASATVLLLGGQDRVGMKAVFVAGAIVLVAIALLIAARYGWLTREVRRWARWARVPPRIYRHIYAPLHHLHLSASPARLSALLAETVFIWMVLYVASYVSIGEMLGMSISISEAMVLLFAAAIGLAIPGAPSGVGTFHAAIVSAFLVIGRPGSEGLVLAVGIHAVFFLAFCLLGAIVSPLVFGTGAIVPTTKSGR
jgi:hypothetical protein